MTLKIETFLGEPLESLASFVINFDNPSIFKTFKLRSEHDFCGLKYKQISVSITVDNMIKTISVTFPFIINSSEFDTITSCHGSPDNSFVNDKLLTENNSENNADGFGQELVKRTYSTKEVGLEGKPVFMLWNKKHFNIKIMFYHEHNGMQLIFGTWE